MKREGNIFDRIICPCNIKRAIRNSSRNKKGKRVVQRVLHNQRAVIDNIQKQLIKGFRPSSYRTAVVFDGASKKERVIQKPKYYPDQIVHWALIMQIEHLIMRGMYDWSCGSVPGRGQAKCKRGVERWLRDDPENTKYCLKLDVRKFYQSVDNEILKGMFRRIIKCSRTLALIDAIIDSTQGLNIGNYTSQWFANYYLQPLDHYIKEKLRYFVRHSKRGDTKTDGVIYFARYVDDMVLFGKNKKNLHKARELIFDYIKNELHLQVKDNWQVFFVTDTKTKNGETKRVGHDVDFLGYRMNHDQTTIRRVLSLRIARRARKIARKAKPTISDCQAMVSYYGFIKNSNSYDYYRKRIKPYVKIKRMRGLIGHAERAKRNKAAAVAGGANVKRHSGADRVGRSRDNNREHRR